MQLTHRIAHFIAITAVLLITASPVFAQPSSKRKPPPPTPAASLPQEVVQDLKDAWNRKRNPRVVVSVGVIRNNTIVFNDKSEAVTRLESVITGELSRAFSGGVVDLDAERKRDDRILKSMQRSVGQDITQDVDQLLKDHFNADVRIEVLFRPRNGILYTESYTFRDLETSTFIDTGTLHRNGNPLGITGADKVLGTVVCMKFAEAFIKDSFDTTSTYSIRVLAQASKKNKIERTLRRLARDIEKEFPEDVKHANVDTEVQDGVVFANFRIRYDGLLRDLLFDIEDYVLEGKGLSWSIITQDKRDAGVYIYKAERPIWHTLTDRKELQAKDATRIRIAKLKGNRLGIVVGSDITDPEGYFTADGKTDASSSNFDNAALRASLVNSFTDLGMKVQADDSIRRRLDTIRNNAERYDNAPHMIEALGDLSSLDYLLHVNIDNSTDGSPRMIARLYDPRDASEIALQIWPSPMANQLTEYSVDDQRPEELARFLAGRLTERWDRQLANNHSTTTVHVRNANSTEVVLGLSGLLRNSIAGIHEVSDIQISGPAVSFDIVHEGDTNQMLFRAIDRIGLAYPGVEVQVLGGVLVVNMSPSVLSEEELAAVRERRIALEPDDVIEPVPPVEIPPQIASDQDRVAQALRDARDSVWVIQVILENGKSWTGTGWTVRDNLLATNAHVVDDIPERLQRGEQVRIIAYSDAGKSRELLLGRAWRHPGYVDNFGLTSGWLDVGLLEVLKGDPGKPLELARDEDLKQLTPPIIAGYVGFPGAGVIRGEIQSKQAFIGQINAIVRTDMISTYDGNSRRDSMMVMHNMTGSGGASGSAIFGPNGKVIALNNSGMESEAKSASGDSSVAVRGAFKGGVLVSTLSRFLEDVEREINP